MIVFETPDALDIRAIKIFGISSKKNKATAIGYFGTGLKYAIAILLRNHQEIEIITGGRKYEFNSIHSTIRFDQFDIVTMNDEELGFTTELGKDWELWMAFRELYSNTLDEKGTVYDASDDRFLDNNKTYVLIKGDKFEKVYNQRDKYFLNKGRRTLVTENDAAEAYEKLPEQVLGVLFYRGIKVGETVSPALYDYNLLSIQTLSEDRSIKNLWAVNWEIGGLVLNSKSERFITNMVICEGNHEAEINYGVSKRPADDNFFLDVIGGLRRRFCDIGINPSAIAYHIAHTKIASVLPTRSCVLNKIEKEQLARAVNFCQDTLELNVKAYKLIVCRRLGNDQNLGSADMAKGVMYISKQCFREGTKRIATAILEEYTHCEHQVQDETVGQKWVYLNQIISLGERIKGEPL